VHAGGFKLWEGAVDLCNFLIQQHQLTPQALQEPSPSSSLRVRERQTDRQTAAAAAVGAEAGDGLTAEAACSRSVVVSFSKADVLVEQCVRTL
jgi:hypothetical protein